MTLVASYEVDHNEIEGRDPILRTHYLHKVDGPKWFITIDETSRTWIPKDKVRTILRSERVTLIPPYDTRTILR